MIAIPPLGQQLCLLGRWDDAVAAWRSARAVRRAIPPNHSQSVTVWLAEFRTIEAIYEGMSARLPNDWAKPNEVALGD